MAGLQAERWAPDGAVHRLVVLCHGVGAEGSDLIDLGRSWAPALPGTAFAAPDAPEAYDGAPFGRQWWSLRDRNPALMAAGAAAAQPLLDAFIDAELTRLGLPPTAYAMAGFSQGAMMVLYAGLRRTTPPAAILAYSGALVAPDRLAERTNDAPVLLVHGDSDDVVPASRSQDAAASLQTAGVPVELIVTPGLGHGIDAAGLSAGLKALRQGFGM